MDLDSNIRRVRERIAQAARQAGREPEEITLCAATKTQSDQTIRAAVAAGIGVCGENRVQELTAHLEADAYAGAQVHFIGHLQTNKVNKVVGRVALIHSVDSLHLLQAVDKQAARLGIPITVFESDIFDVTVRVEKNPCYLCARMRRGFLYSKARELGCNKIALGHHLSDVLETTLLGLFYGAQLQTMPPKLHSRNFPGMELIRPLYCVHEDAIIAWKNYNHLRFLQCACRFTEARDASGDGVGESKRQEIKLLLRQLKKTNPNVEKSIFQAIHGVQLDTFPGFKYRGRFHSFLEYYSREDAGFDPEDGI